MCDKLLNGQTTSTYIFVNSHTSTYCYALNERYCIVIHILYTRTKIMFTNIDWWVRDKPYRMCYLSATRVGNGSERS